jgi:hypothetical protein
MSCSQLTLTHQRAESEAASSVCVGCDLALSRADEVGLIKSSRVTHAADTMGQHPRGGCAAIPLSCNTQKQGVSYLYIF